jgi:hypothetical protein
LDILKKLPGLVSINQSSNHYILSCSKDTRENIFQFATETKNAIIELSRESENLESVFHQLTTTN